MKKIWIVGSLGHMGQALIRLLDMMEYELYETDKDELDITDEHAVSLFMHRNRPDVVINCAGYHPSAGAAQSETDMAYKVNAVGARNLAQSAESIQAKLIQISTDDVFSSASDTPYNEFDDVNPVGLFAKSKYAGEKFVIQLMTRYVIIRSSWIYGIGKDFLNEVLEAAVDPQVSTMELLNNDRAVPTSAAELARVVKFFIDNDHYGIYHAVCSGGSCTRLEFAKEILRLAGGDPASAADFCRMNFLLGELFCEAGEALCAQTGTKLSDIDLIGSHGQTFWHIPEKEEYLSRTFASTFQLGEEAVLAERFGCPVVGNFRVRDVAAGGLGAPLVPYTEFLLYRSETEHTALQNIGGIGNITLLPAGCALSDVTAFDTGPGNMLIDAAIARITNGEKRYDANGAMAASGRVSEALLAQLMRDPYLSRCPPKTTGREHYGAAFVDGIFAAANERKLSDADILATVTDFPAQTIAAAIRDFCAVRPARLIVGGGGSRNGTLMADIAAALPDVRVLTNEDLGFDGDAKEAVAFAVLANEAIFARCSNAPGATGARHGAVLGKITL